MDPTGLIFSLLVNTPPGTLPLLPLLPPLLVSSTRTLLPQYPLKHHNGRALSQPSCQDAYSSHSLPASSFPLHRCYLCCQSPPPPSLHINWPSSPALSYSFLFSHLCVSHPSLGMGSVIIGRGPGPAPASSSSPRFILNPWIVICISVNRPDSSLLMEKQ